MEELEMEKEFEDRIKVYLNENFEGSYSSGVDIDYKNRRAYFCVTFGEGAEFPSIGKFVDEIIEELGIEERHLKSDIRKADNIYRLMVMDRENYKEIA
jgi:hypothetical protein